MHGVTLPVTLTLILTLTQNSNPNTLTLPLNTNAARHSDWPRIDKLAGKSVRLAISLLFIMLSNGIASRLYGKVTVAWHSGDPLKLDLLGFTLEAFGRGFVAKLYVVWGLIIACASLRTTTCRPIESHNGARESILAGPIAISFWLKHPANFRPAKLPTSSPRLDGPVSRHSSAEGWGWSSTEGARVEMPNLAEGQGRI